jgi:MerR family transcriptional regulator, light-induced transcriptional regulator
VSEPGYLRIGELARRTGASPEVLRAWERRYGLLRPTRSQGGFRLYTAADEERIRRMREYLARGLAAAEAARLAVDAETPGPDADTTPAVLVPETTAAAPPPLEAAARELAGALDRFEEEQAHAVLDQLLAAYRIETILRDLLVPYLHELGERWARGEVSVAQEHLPPTCSEAACSGWPAAGAKATVQPPSWPACRASSTTLG